MTNTTQSRLRNCCITVNNYTTEQYETLVSLTEDNVFKYIVIGKEVGANGTPHLQIYVELKNARSFKSIHKQFYKGHIETRKGTAKQAADYCKKEGDFYEYGEISNPGKRTDLEQAKDIITTGSGKMRDVVEIGNYQTMKTCEKILSYKERKRNWEPEVYWLYGPTGTGKSRKAVEKCGPDFWMSKNTLRWWCGYDAHENVIFDDFRKDFCTFHELLRILDRYPYRVETKGGSRELLAKKIYITCPYHPRTMYDTREDVEQLMRRITKVEYIGPEDTTEVKRAPDDYTSRELLNM